MPEAMVPLNDTRSAPCAVVHGVAPGGSRLPTSAPGSTPRLVAGAESAMQATPAAESSAVEKQQQKTTPRHALKTPAAEDQPCCKP
jgi:hypothetical protein